MSNNHGENNPPERQLRQIRAAWLGYHPERICRSLVTDCGRSGALPPPARRHDSPVFRLIYRFSEDIDIFLDRAALGFTGKRDLEDEDFSNTRRKQLDKQLRKAIQNEVATTAMPLAFCLACSASSPATLERPETVVRVLCGVSGSQAVGYNTGDQRLIVFTVPTPLSHSKVVLTVYSATSKEKVLLD